MLEDIKWWWTYVVLYETEKCIWRLTAALKRPLFKFVVGTYCRDCQHNHDSGRFFRNSGRGIGGMKE